MIDTHDMTLTEAERTSPAWLSMKAKFQARLEKLRLRNDDPTLTEMETATLRGRIQCLKEVLSLDKVPPRVTAAQQTFVQSGRASQWS